MPLLLRWVDFAKTYSRSAVEIDATTNKVVGGGVRIGMAGLYDGRTNAELSRPNIDPNDESVKKTALTMWQTEHSLLNESGTFYISGEMSRLVTEAAELAVPEPLFLTDLSSPSGLLVLEEPVIIADLHPHTGEVVADLMPIRAIGWRRQSIGKRDGTGETDGIVLICYADKRSYDEIYVTKLREMLPEETFDNEHLEGPQMIAIEFHPWAFGTDWSSTDHIMNSGQGRIISGVAFLRRWFMSLSRLMWQRLLQPEQWHPDRAGYRQFERVRGKDAPQATVLHLRRFVDNHIYREKEDPESWLNWPYPYRTPVRPHWRRQWFATLGPARNDDGTWNQMSHRLVFIARHYRGPDHLPIQERDDVTAIVR